MPNLNPEISTLPTLVPKPEKSLRKPNFAELGQTGLKRFNGRVYEEFLTNLQGLQGVKVYREMSDNDDIIGASLYAIERVIASTNWYVQPYDDSNDSLKDADFIKDCMNDMEHSWGDFILEGNSCLTYGWSLLEEVYKLRKGDNVDKRIDSKFNDGLVGWRKFAPRLQSTLYVWDIADNGDIKGMVQSPPPTYEYIYIPLDKAIHFRTKLNGNNPEGRSILRNSYRTWYFKKNIQMLEAIGIERDLVGLPWIEPPEDFDIADPGNAEVLTYIRQLLGNLRRDEQEGVFLPPGWKISLLGSGATRRQFDLDKTINRHDKRIAVTMLAQFIMLGLDRVGSFALSKNQDDLFKLAVQGHLNRMADTINTYSIPRLFRLNPNLGKGNKLPKILPGNISSPSLSDLANYITALGKVGLLPTESKAFVDAIIRAGRFFEANPDKIGDIWSETSKNTIKTNTVPATNTNTNMVDDAAKPIEKPKPVSSNVE